MNPGSGLELNHGSYGCMGQAMPSMGNDGDTHYIVTPTRSSFAFLSVMEILLNVSIYYLFIVFRYRICNVMAWS